MGSGWFPGQCSPCWSGCWVEVALSCCFHRFIRGFTDFVEGFVVFEMFHFRFSPVLELSFVFTGFSGCSAACQGTTFGSVILECSLVVP